MINSLIPGGKIDIHGGGFDLKFPHHENEIAQEEAMYGHKIAIYWMHYGFINIDNVKMSKSLGNVKQAKEMLKMYGGNVVIYILINSYYRTPVNFSDSLAEAAKKELDKISQSYQKLAVKLQLEGFDVNSSYEGELDLDGFVNSLCDDLNTPNALTELFRVVKESNVSIRQNPFDGEKGKKIFFTLKEMFNILGLEIEYITLTEDDKTIFNKYNEAKANKDFAKSDELRKVLIERKII